MEHLQLRVNQSIENTSKIKMMKILEKKKEKKEVSRKSTQKGNEEHFSSVDEVKKATQTISQDLEGIDYILNILTNQDSH